MIAVSPPRCERARGAAVRPGLRAEQERRADLRGRRARRERRRDRRAVGDSAGSDERQVVARSDARSSSRSGRSRSSASSSVPRWPPASAPCTTSASARRRPRLALPRRVVTVTHTAGRRARSASSARALGQPNVVETTAHARGERDVELLVEIVVVEARLAELDAPARRLSLQLLRVRDVRVANGEVQMKQAIVPISTAL